MYKPSELAELLAKSRDENRFSVREEPYNLGVANEPKVPCEYDPFYKTIKRRNKKNKNNK
jgi:hypothetical protein